jgi:hypothetical protein
MRRGAEGKQPSRRFRRKRHGMPSVLADTPQKRLIGESFVYGK